MPRRPLIVPAVAEDPTHKPAVARRDFLARLAAAVGVGMLAFSGRDEAKAATTGIDPYIGELMLFAGNFAPNGWALCHGQTIAIATNTALFSILGTTYGGNGVTTFNLPDLRGRVPICFGQGPGLPFFNLGEQSGEVSHTLNPAEMPLHNHVMSVSDANGTQSTPANAFLARDPAGSPAYGVGTSASLNPAAMSPAGGSLPHNNMQPYLTLTWCIALQGIFPPRG